MLLSMVSIWSWIGHQVWSLELYRLPFRNQSFGMASQTNSFTLTTIRRWWLNLQVGYLGGERDDADRQLARRIDEIMGSVVNLQEKLSAGDQEEDEGDEGKVKSGGIIEWLMSSLKSSSVSNWFKSWEPKFLVRTNHFRSIIIHSHSIEWTYVN